MKKFHILVIVILGFFLIPMSAFACGNNSEKQSCKKEVTSKTDKKDCCKSDSNSTDKDHKECDGKCGHSKCACTSTSVPFTSTCVYKIKNHIFNFSYEKQKFYQSETFISSGFYSLWLIPKIS
jgi:hypothetical protein